MKKLAAFLGFITIFFIGIFLLGDFSYEYKEKGASGFGVETEADKFARFSYEYNLLKNPKTGKIPSYMRTKEITFASTLSNNLKSQQADSLDWLARGPYNVGGRTRAFAIDKNNEDIMIAGGASSGVWKTIDGGENWYKVSDSDHSLSITTIVQDPREGRNNEWYYGTGELYGASQSGDGAFYLGSGMYKSTDNGETWSPFSQNENSATAFNTVWQGIWKIAIDPSNLEETEIYVATLARVYKTTNDGETWDAVLSSSLSNYSYFTDVLVSPTGVVYAGMSRENDLISFGLSPVGGIWRSEDGEDFTKILPEDFPPTYNRIALAMNPQNENELHFLVSNVDTLYGNYGSNTISEPEYNALWKYEYLEGDGTGTGGNWTDLSANLPIGEYDFDDFYAQGGYNLAVAYKPDDSNTLFIAGTNIYRSTDAFQTANNTSFMGGYKQTTNLPLIDVESYDNHHPDIHGITFLPSNPDVLFTMSDGGVHKTFDCMANTTTWESLNNGYLSSQIYTLAIEEFDTTNAILAGFQDNGTQFVGTKAIDADWVLTYLGDGSHAAFPRDRDYLIASSQVGQIIKATIDEQGNILEYQRIDPALADEDKYSFINPLCLDANNNNTLYLPIGNELWINNDIDEIALNNNFEKLATGWFSQPSTLPTNAEITVIHSPINIAGRVYIGADNGNFYVMDAANEFGSEMIDKTPTNFPNGSISSIASNPENGLEVLISFSNYEIYSAFHTLDGGDTWTKVAGNLEQFDSGSGNGPSIRSAAIVSNENGTSYLLGTSVGLFSTNNLNDIETEWEQIAVESISNSIVTAIKTRTTDDLIVVGTHGNGIYSANTPEDIEEEVTDIETLEIKGIKVFPNPANNILNIEYTSTENTPVTFTIMDVLGRIILTKKANSFGNSNTENFDISALNAGNYYLNIETQHFKKAISFVKL